MNGQQARTESLVRQKIKMNSIHEIYAEASITGAGGARAGRARDARFDIGGRVARVAREDDVDDERNGEHECDNLMRL